MIYWGQHDRTNRGNKLRTLLPGRTLPLRTNTEQCTLTLLLPHSHWRTIIFFFTHHHCLFFELILFLFRPSKLNCTFIPLLLLLQLHHQLCVLFFTLRHKLAPITSHVLPLFVALCRTIYIILILILILTPNSKTFCTCCTLPTKQGNAQPPIISIVYRWNFISLLVESSASFLRRQTTRTRSRLIPI